MQNSIPGASSSDIDEVSRAEAEVAVRKAELSRSLREAGQSSEQMVQRLRTELKPAMLAALALAGLAAVAGITIAVARRRRRTRWLPAEQPSTVATAARGAGMFLLRLVARQVTNQLVAKLDAATTAPRAVGPTTTAAP
jgi:hypothetical protein